MGNDVKLNNNNSKDKEKLSKFGGTLDIFTYAKTAGLTATRPHAVVKVPLSELVDIGSILYALVFHPDWLIRSSFRLRRRSKIIHKSRGYESSPFTGVHKRVTS